MGAAVAEGSADRQVAAAHSDRRRWDGLRRLRDHGLPVLQARQRIAPRFDLRQQSNNRTTQARLQEVMEVYSAKQPQSMVEFFRLAQYANEHSYRDLQIELNRFYQ